MATAVSRCEAPLQVLSGLLDALLGCRLPPLVAAGLLLSAASVSASATAWPAGHSGSGAAPASMHLQAKQALGATQALATGAAAALSMPPPGSGLRAMPSGGLRPQVRSRTGSPCLNFTGCAACSLFDPSLCAHGKAR